MQAGHVEGGIRLHQLTLMRLRVLAYLAEVLTNWWQDARFGPLSDLINQVLFI